MIVEYKHLKRPRYIVEFDESRVHKAIWTKGVNEFGNTSGWLPPFKTWMALNDFGIGTDWDKQYEKIHSWLISKVSQRRGGDTPFALYFDDLEKAVRFDSHFGSRKWLETWLRANVDSSKFSIMN